MKLTPTTIRWMLNHFPPLYFNQIKIVEISPDFKRMRVKVKLNLFNRNLNRSMFGGTIFSAGDPFLPVMYWQYFNHLGYRVDAWLKDATIAYLAPVTTSLVITYQLKDEDIEEAKLQLDQRGRAEIKHQVEMWDQNLQLCVKMNISVVIKEKIKKLNSVFSR